MGTNQELLLDGEQVAGTARFAARGSSSTAVRVNDRTAAALRPPRTPSKSPECPATSPRAIGAVTNRDARVVENHVSLEMKCRRHGVVGMSACRNVIGFATSSRRGRLSWRFATGA